MDNNQEQEQIMDEMEGSGGEATLPQEAPEDNYVYEICQLFDKDNDETIYMKDLLDLIKALGIGLNEETKPIINNFIEKINEEKISFDDFFQLYDLLNQHKKPKEEENDYGYIAEQIQFAANTLCKGRLIAVLEGGYNVDKGFISPFAQSVLKFTRHMNIAINMLQCNDVKIINQKREYLYNEEMEIYTNNIKEEDEEKEEEKK